MGRRRDHPFAQGPAACRSRLRPPVCRALQGGRSRPPRDLAAAQGPGDDASIVPCGGGAGAGRALQDTSAANRQCTPPSAPCGAATSPCRGGFWGLPFERLPCKGLRSRAPPAAETARRSRCRGRRMQARFSVRRMMRAPQTGNVGASRLRGAAPCPANTLPGCLKPPRRGGWRRRTGFGGQTVRGRLTISGGDAKKLCEEGPLMSGNCE